MSYWEIARNEKANERGEEEKEREKIKKCRIGYSQFLIFQMKCMYLRLILLFCDRTRFQFTALKLQSSNDYTLVGCVYFKEHTHTRTADGNKRLNFLFGYK